MPVILGRMSLTNAYDAEAFRAAGHRLVDGLAEHLSRALGRDSVPVLSQVPPDRLLEEIDGTFPAEPMDDLVDTLLTVAAHSNRLHHPRYIGHQVAPVLPQAALAEMTTALLNNGMAIYEMGQAHTIMEPIAGYQGPLDGAPRADEGADLDQLIDHSVGTDLPIVITEHGVEVGVVTKPVLLRGIQGGKE